MQLLLLILLATTKLNIITDAFVSQSSLSTIVHHVQRDTTQLHTTAQTEAERLLAKARALREEASREDELLHTTLLTKKYAQDSATDSLIDELFPGDVDDVVHRLREKRLASDMLVRIVERLHEREISAKGLEHVEPTMENDQLSFKRVAQTNEAELSRLQGCLSKLIEAAEVLDKEFLDEKLKCQGKITHSDIMHWGGGETATILKDKAKELGREHDEQFLERLESFYNAAKRKHSKDDVDGTSWRDKDTWEP